MDTSSDNRKRSSGNTQEKKQNYFSKMFIQSWYYFSPESTNPYDLFPFHRLGKGKNRKGQKKTIICCTYLCIQKYKHTCYG